MHFLGNMSLYKESAVGSTGADKCSNIEQGNMKQQFNSNVDALSPFLFCKGLYNDRVQL